MFFFVFHHWVIFVIVGVASLVFLWIFWELRHPGIDPSDLPPRPYEEGSLRDIDDYKPLSSWKQPKQH